jgi:hypothetical protein
MVIKKIYGVGEEQVARSILDWPLKLGLGRVLVWKESERESTRKCGVLRDF